MSSFLKKVGYAVFGTFLIANAALANQNFNSSCSETQLNDISLVSNSALYDSRCSYSGAVECQAYCATKGAPFYNWSLYVDGLCHCTCVW